jgi:RHS repeat-associated protein
LLLACSQSADTDSSDHRVTAPPAPEPLVLPTSPVITATSAGYLPASWEVTPGGQLVYTIPLDVPAGRAGMQPHLALTYSSNRGNGPLGVGWSLAGGSEITRCGRTLATEGGVDGVDYRDDEPAAERDRLCLDGRKLVEVGAAEYRTEHESHAKIVRDPSGEFTVYPREGAIRTYRPARSPRWRADATGLEHEDQVDERWLLAVERDRPGNAVHYNYSSIDDGNGGVQNVLATIEYTRFRDAPGYRRVVFGYEDRRDHELAWRGGVRTSLVKRLATITMHAPNPASTQPVWIYRLSYQQSEATERSLLSSVKKCGILPSGTETGCLWSKRFGWYGHGGLKFTPDAVYSSKVGPATHGGGVRNALIHVLDVDADGADDALFQPGMIDGEEEPLLLQSRVTATATEPLATRWFVGANGSEFPGAAALEAALPVDVDSDGTSEVFLRHGSGSSCELRFLHWSIDRFVTQQSLPAATCAAHAKNMFLDFDGDARLDYLSAGGDNYWHLERNTGSGFDHVDGYPLSEQLYATDFDGDGRAEAFGRDPTSFGSDPQVLHQDDAGQPRDIPSVDIPKGLPEACEGNLDPRPFSFGDFNGDGLADVIEMCEPKTGSATISLRWNTGNGYGPRIAIDGTTTGIDRGHLYAKLRVGDMDHDGIADLVVFHQLPQPGITILRSRGDGTFTLIPLTGGPGYWLDWTFLDPWPKSSFKDPYPTSKLGDFNGDGHLDLVRVQVANEVGTIEVLQQRAHQADRLMSISDANTVWERERITYDTRWSDKAEPRKPCAYPLHCVTRGLTVVRSVESRAHVAEASPTGAAHTLYYAYQDPVADMRGYGFLGFRKFQIWDPARPMETTMTFDNRVAFSSRPTTVQTVVATRPVEEQGKGITEVEAHVTRATYEHERAELNDGTTFAEQPRSWASIEWEEQVAIDWGTIDPAPGNSTSDHIFGVEVTPWDWLRWRTGSSTYDSRGNETKRIEGTAGLQRVETTTTYLSSSDDWLIARPHRRCTTLHGDGAPVTRCFEHTWGDHGLLSSIIRDEADPSKRSTTSFQYDGYGLPTSVIRVADDANPATSDTRRIYIEYAPVWPGQPDERVFPSQQWRRFEPLEHRPSTWFAFHPALGLISAWMDQNGVQGTARYDALGRLRSTLVDGQAEMTVGYAGRPDSFGGMNGLVTTATRGGVVTKYATDALGRIIDTASTAFDGSQTRVAKRFDVLGRLASESRPYSATPTAFTTHSYDPLDRLLKTTLPDGTAVIQEHEFEETRTFDAGNRQSRVRYDVDGRIIESTSFSGATPITTAYHYGPSGAVDRITDPAGNVIVTEVDNLGRVIRKQDPSAGTFELTYNGFDELITKRHVETGELSTYVHDELGRVVRTIAPEGDTQLTWDTRPNGIGKLAQTTAPGGVATVHHYDSFGRSTGVDQTQDGETFNLAWTWTNAGQLHELRYPSINGATPGFILRHVYNAAGQLAELRDATTSVTSSLWRIDGRNRDNALTAAQYGNGFTVSRSYTPDLGRLSTMRIKNGATSVFDLGYTYHPDGFVKTRSDALIGTAETYGYDELSRMTSWTLTAGTTSKTTNYEYDPVGNLTRVARDQQVLEQYTYGDSTGPYELTSQTVGSTATSFAYDAHGRQVQAGTRSLADFTSFDLPRRIQTGTSVTTLRYSAFGERVAKQSSSAASVYVGKLYERRTERGRTTHLFRVYSPDGPLAEIAQGPTTRTTTYLATDALGTVAATIRGTLVERQVFDPWGKRSALTNVNELGFTGHQHDDEAGLVNMRGRLYDPAQRRMLTVDPHVTHPFLGQSWNPYAYALDNPTNVTDPTGLDASMYDDCTYFVDGCGDGLNDLIGDPVGAVTEVFEQSVGYGTGQLGWAQSPGGAGYGGITQSTEDGYAELGTGNLDVASPGLVTSYQGGGDVTCGTKGNPRCGTPAERDAGRTKDVRRQLDFIDAMVKHFGTLRSPLDVTSAKLRIIQTMTSNNYMRVEHTAAIIFNIRTGQARISRVFTGELHETEVDFDALTLPDAYGNVEVDINAGDRIIGVIHSHPALGSGKFSEGDIQEAKKFLTRVTKDNDERKWQHPTIGVHYYLIYSVTMDALTGAPGSYGAFLVYDRARNTITPIP